MKTSTCILDDKGNIVFDTFEFAVAYNKEKQKAVDEYIQTHEKDKKIHDGLKGIIFDDMERYARNKAKDYGVKRNYIYQIINEIIFEVLNNDM